MSAHNSEDATERFCIGRLRGAELVAFETHLLHCSKCQIAVHAVDLFVRTLRLALESPTATASRPAPSGSPREYLVVDAALASNTVQENIGVLLVDTHSDRLFSRFRRDFEVFASDDAQWLSQLADEVWRADSQFGAARCIEWLATSFFNKLGFSRREGIPQEEYSAATVDDLYAKHIRPNVLPFRTHLPRYTIEAAGGKFSRQMAVEPEGWVEVRADIPLTDDMFVTHVKGRSMEPEIPDNSLCAFRSTIDGPAEGKVVLMEQYGEPGGSRYTVKTYRLSASADPDHPGDPAWLHERVTLESINPDYQSWDVASAAQTRVLGEFLFVV